MPRHAITRLDALGPVIKHRDELVTHPAVAGDPTERDAASRSCSARGRCRERLGDPHRGMIVELGAGEVQPRELRVAGGGDELGDARVAERVLINAELA